MTNRRYIRSSTLDDYASLADVHNAIYPDRRRTAEAWAENDRQRNPKCRAQRWVAVVDEQIAGFGGYSQSIFDYDPRKFEVVVEVRPESQRRGIGSALYDQVMAGLKSFDPGILRADGYSNLPQGVRFLEQRGFEEVFRETPMRLDVAAFDPVPYGGLVPKLRAQEIEIKTLRDLESDPGRDRKVYELYWKATDDVPKEHDIPWMDFDEWTEWTLKDPLLDPEGYFVAVRGDDYIGISEFGMNQGDDALIAGLVGVNAAFRNKGIALAMQVRAIAYARAKGHALIKTSTAVGNAPMQSMYARLGFVRQPDWIQFEKCLPTS